MSAAHDYTDYLRYRPATRVGDRERRLAAADRDSGTNAGRLEERFGIVKTSMIANRSQRICKKDLSLGRVFLFVYGRLLPFENG